MEAMMKENTENGVLDTYFWPQSKKLKKFMVNF